MVYSTIFIFIFTFVGQKQIQVSSSISKSTPTSFLNMTTPIPTESGEIRPLEIKCSPADGGYGINFTYEGVMYDHCITAYSFLMRSWCSLTRNWIGLWKYCDSCCVGVFHEICLCDNYTFNEWYSDFEYKLDKSKLSD